LFVVGQAAGLPLFIGPEAQRRGRTQPTARPRALPFVPAIFAALRPPGRNGRPAACPTKKEPPKQFRAPAEIPAAARDELPERYVEMPHDFVLVLSVSGARPISAERPAAPGIIN
jgi:hypothetical protein